MKNEHVESFPLTDRFDYLSRAWSKRQKKSSVLICIRGSTCKESVG